MYIRCTYALKYIGLRVDTEQLVNVQYVVNMLGTPSTFFIFFPMKVGYIWEFANYFIDLAYALCYKYKNKCDRAFPEMIQAIIVLTL